MDLKFVILQLASLNNKLADLESNRRREDELEMCYYYLGLRDAYRKVLKLIDLEEELERKEIAGKIEFDVSDILAWRDSKNAKGNKGNKGGK